MTKVLIVLDGDYRFVTAGPTDDFTYNVLFDTLVAAGFDVTRAHRQVDPDADFSDFNFETSVDLRDFDVLWLLGFLGRNAFGSTADSSLGLGAPEEAGQLAAIARFMDAGGGVFATGDHDSIGSEMCGHIPRVRAMRSWYGSDDDSSPMPAAFPRNFPSLHLGRADTTQRNPAGNYAADASLVWFENQSDSVPQPITPTPSSPAHPILRYAGADIDVFPDHMHEGKTHDIVGSYLYDQSIAIGGDTFTEFPEIDGVRQKPQVIATGQSLAVHQRSAASDTSIDDVNAEARTINTLSVYEGRNAGVGRIVTGSTFHHYIDINLTGDIDIVTPAQKARTGPDAEKGHGFAHPTMEAAEVFARIKAVYVNITHWLARPRPALNLILERSTFSQDEAGATPNFDGAILVTVDGLKPNQFPAGGILTLDSDLFDPSWAPVITPEDATGLSITAISVSSDDPMLSQRLQRFTFRYRVHLDDTAFFQPVRPVRVDASLTSPAFPAPLADQAWIQLVEAANPFMLDLEQGNQTVWLSSDLRVFPVVADGSLLLDNANRAQALDYLHNLVDNMNIADFEALPLGQAESALSSLPTTTGSGKPVYNFAIARVRLSADGAAANDVRVFFRIVPSPTTAALTYQESMPGVPIATYMKTAGTSPIALPGTNAAETEWVSFPVFADSRVAPASQTDPTNVKPIPAAQSSTFFGALIDNNLTDAYLKPTPGPAGSAISLPDLMMGEHQCIVAQIEYAPTPIPDGAKPSTSDKLSQRNLALSAIPNPGVDGSRTALHTFEIEATPNPIVEDFPPDELILEWRGRMMPPDGTEVRIWIPTWNAADVVELADRLYARHELRVVDANTIAVPGGGVRYVPVPRSFERATGIVMADFPLGVSRGERFDLQVRQVSNRGRQAKIPPPKVTNIPREEAAKLLAGQAPPGAVPATAAAAALPRGVFDLGGNRTLVTDLSVFDASGDHAVLVDHPEPALVAAAVADSGHWRETIGAFQLGVPVSVKADILAHHLRLLSVLRWRAQWLRPNGRWYRTFRRYVELIADKVQALGGDPWSVPATPDGHIKLPGDGGGAGGDGTGTGDGAEPEDFWRRYCPIWLALLILLLLLILLILLLTQ
jgi:hypothetical protein